MALSRDDFVRALQGQPLSIPPNAFGSATERGADLADDPDLRRAVDWLKGFMSPSEWQRRRDAAFIRLYCSAFGLTRPDSKGRFFDEFDTFGWYLFLADAFLDHPWNYEPMFGSRVIPVITAIGRDLELMRSVDGLDERVRRLVTQEHRQPNGGIFELLVAAAYRRAGAKVAFRREERGVAKTHDLDVNFEGREFAVECKRMETSEYGERERARMRQLWGPASILAQSVERSTFGNVSFAVPVFEVPERYLCEKVSEWLKSGLPSLLWTDEISQGVVGDLDLGPLRKILKSEEVLAAGTRLLEILTGKYLRHANYLQATRVKPGMSPRYIAECDLAILLRWKTLASASVNAKARDVLRKLAEANKQLPTDKPGIVHIGFEAVEGDEVERARYEKILASAEKFDPQGKPLRYVYCHYFVPESPPDELWGFDETVQWRRITGTDPLPLPSPFLVLPKEVQARDGMHWQD